MFVNIGCWEAWAMDSGSSVIEELLRESGGAAVIDGGMATELERHGADLNDPLWSAKCLISSPHLIRQVPPPPPLSPCFPSFSVYRLLFSISRMLKMVIYQLLWCELIAIIFLSEFKLCVPRIMLPYRMHLLLILCF